ncbi:3,4-dihydroxyphenylacetate 2,3-dioxygenase [Methylocella sp. CPCC 101449]|jgi:3,4-dihydroxyphenylacetate 2,3-dioxygenase|uniref:3,4-dihydroxyphenylacetate 2,3-dioxygenase n=1 Tax=Methylocella sp. CPCC 101449 TaxID=2987531 RepID=UPI00288C6A0C|nr:3,4-dihydroxyphenylacetate 2,3-dioxygenase [Methylocella sp. CPCC 101449]MDT2022928.1 3,4-dihydroxyphenylacetate 2,3-dioxygenase [Methylocella sp. CPCC 101449]HEV2570427.1 3,4-dihydroxyphenylacetate 2,3-dioxygenase [Beijerinckiaceae bacterium]
MGQVVLAAKITHVPSILISERPGPLFGQRAEAIQSLRELGQRARARQADTFVIFDVHWISNFGCHMNANARHVGTYTSHEAPHMIQDMAYDYPGNPDLGEAIAVEAKKDGLDVMAHQVPTLPLEYGTIVPMHYMNEDGHFKVISVAAPIFATWQENRKFGIAVRRAIEASPYRVAVLASGSLSHKLVSNEQVGDDQWDVVGSEFNRQVDLRVLDLWRERRYAEFCRMLPDYSTKCNGEGLMVDTHMLFGMLGWDKYAGRAEELCPYFPSSGSGQITVEFHLDA